MDSIPIQISFNVYTDKRGIQYVVPDAEDLDQRIASAKRDIHDCLHDIEKGADKTLTLQRLHLLERIEEHARCLRDKYLPDCKTISFDLRAPSYDEYTAWQDFPGVRKSENGVDLINDEKLAKIMVPKCLLGMSEEEKKKIPIDLFKRLYLLLKEALQPDAAALPTLS